MGGTPVPRSGIVQESTDVGGRHFGEGAPRVKNKKPHRREPDAAEEPKRWVPEVPSVSAS